MNKQSRPLREAIVSAVAKLLGIEIGIYDWSKEPSQLPCLISDYDQPKERDAT